MAGIEIQPYLGPQKNNRTNALLYEQKKKIRSKFTDSSANGIIAEITVWNNATGRVYIYSNGTWAASAPPIITPGAGNLSLQLSIKNTGGIRANFTCTIIDSTGTILQSVTLNNVSPNAFASTPIWTGIMPPTTYKLTFAVTP
jgi:hypothetical protein